MEYLIGFLIALFIALTGVGAGTLTVPVLVLFLNVPAPIAVGIGLTFSATVKLILVPTQIAHGNVAWRTLGTMLLGGAPGVLLGALLLRNLASAGADNAVGAILGAVLVGTATWQILFSFRPLETTTERRSRNSLLGVLMFLVGSEVGFSSAGAGALGSAALLSLTTLEPAQIVGTDLTFGLLVSLLGSGAHWTSFVHWPHLLRRLVVGGIFGALAGTLLSKRVPRRQLRFALWIWLFILGGWFLLNSFNVWAKTH